MLYFFTWLQIDACDLQAESKTTPLSPLAALLKVIDICHFTVIMLSLTDTDRLTCLQPSIFISCSACRGEDGHASNEHFKPHLSPFIFVFLLIFCSFFTVLPLQP